MKNREKLLNMAMYDLLMKIDKGISDDTSCIIEALTGRADCWRPEGVVDESCKECVQKWLNEEAKT